MSKKDEALKLALEALERALSDDRPYIVQCKEAITAIRQALAEQEIVLPGGGHVPAVPVAVYGYCPECGGAGVMRERRPNGDDKCTNGHKYPSSKALVEQPAQQEPVANICIWHKNGEQHAELWNWDKGIETLPDGDYNLYTTPPQRKPWVSLTDEEWQEIDASLNGKRDLARIFVRAIEAKLREKNS